MKSSLRAALAFGALALAATSASASTISLTSGSVHQVFDNPSAWIQIDAQAGVTGAKFKLSDTLNDGYSVTYQLFEADQSSNVGTSWIATDIGQTAANLALAGVYRAMTAGQTYFLKVDFVGPSTPDAWAVGTQVSAVPLPGAALLFGSALMGFGALRRKQKSGEKPEVAVA